MDEPREPKQEAAFAKVRCPNCGKEHPATARFCPECGRPVRAPGSRPTFGPRYAAFLVDATVIIAISALAQPLSSMFVGRTGLDIAGLDAPAAVGTIVQVLLLPVVALLYFAITEGRTGRTAGKRVVGLRVKKLGGGRAGFARALLRAMVIWGPLVVLVGGQIGAGISSSTASIAMVRIGAFLFAVIWFGNLLLALFWRERRGIHDLIAGTETLRD